MPSNAPDRPAVRLDFMRRPFGAMTATALGIVLVGLGLGRAQVPDDPTPAKAPTFVGVRVGKVYHRATCPTLRKVAAKGRVNLADTAAAEAGGYKACPTCKPDDPAAGDPHADTAARPVKVGDAPGEVVFSRDVAPVLVAACLSCHGGAQAKKKLDMNTFATLLKGSENGPVIGAATRTRAR